MKHLIGLVSNFNIDIGVNNVLGYMLKYRIKKNLGFRKTFCL